MKKLLISFIALSMSLLAYSQSEHMKFMGIPLDGTINTFQAKLATKEVKPDARTNVKLPVGVRAFDGDFAGYEARIFVYYDKNTKIVYRAKACITVTSKSIFEQRYKQIANLVDSKYDGDRETGEMNGHESLSISTGLGDVSVYTTVFTESYPIEYNVHVDYEDFLNGLRHRKSQLDDI